MAEATKIFISWSGDYSKRVALLLRDWLQELFDNVQPFVSDRDIEPGARSMAVIERELSDTTFGIVLATKDNQDAPWINFEAGALSKEVGDSANRVIPLLLDMASPTELTGPLSQFQAQKYDKAGMQTIVTAIAAAIGANADAVAKRFDRSWDDFQSSVAAVPAGQGSTTPPRSLDDKMDESLAILRAIRESVSPPPTIRSTSDNSRPHSSLPTQVRVNDYMAKHGIRGQVSREPGSDHLRIETYGAPESAIERLGAWLTSRLPGQSWTIHETPF